MSSVFDYSEINGMQLVNRFVRSATWEGMAADDGSVTQPLVDTMVNLAHGGVGLIITSHAYVRDDGQAGSRQIGVSKDSFIPGLNKMTDAVHRYESKIVLQLAHAGMFALQKTEYLPLAVSHQQNSDQLSYKIITEQDVRELADAYAQGAVRAQKAGFDGVQIHSAHGYLLSQFLSPAYNDRHDQYGGDIYNRSRALLEIYQAIRVAVGKNYPILIKINCQDFIENGLNLDDSIRVGQLLTEAGINAIELSGGMLSSKKLSPSRPLRPNTEEVPYYINEANEYKKSVKVPLILVGGIRSLQMAESLIKGGTADYIAMSRPFIREPHLINRWKNGELDKAECKSDNRCFRMAMSGNGISCDRITGK